MTATEHRLTVGELARTADVSVRTLHHYDELGLVVASERSEGGYRLYGPEAVNRLQEVLFFRELGFGLEAIKDIVVGPGYDRGAVLGRQRRLVERKAERLIDMMDALDKAIEAERQGVEMSPEEKLEVFGEFDPEAHVGEAEERWGDSDAYKQSAQRTGTYTKADWEKIGEENRQINNGLLALIETNVPATDAAAMDLAEAHRKHISTRFYDCSYETHAGLGEMYVADERFRSNIDKAGEGLAEYLSAAIAANVARHS